MDAPILNGIKRAKVEVFGNHLRKMGASTMNVTTVGIDLAKNVLQVHGKSTLLGISKRGDVYLRTLLIHGARSAILAARRRNDSRNGWLANLLTRRHANIAAVALANKNVRTVLGAAGTRSRLQSRLRAAPNSRLVGTVTACRYTHHRLLRRSRSDGKPG
jgi:hypothetical protein